MSFPRALQDSSFRIRILNKQRINLLSHDHSEVDDLLQGVLEALTQGDPATAYNRLDFFWARLAMHIRAEHLHLFPAILKPDRNSQTVDLGPIEDVIARLRADHNYFMTELAGVVKTMRGIQQNNTVDHGQRLDSVKQRVERLHRRLLSHNSIEEASIYPLIESSLSRDEAAEVCRQIRQELENLPQRFRDGKAAE
jgi:hemerythrin superfamily protein